MAIQSLRIVVRTCANLFLGLLVAMSLSACGGGGGSGSLDTGAAAGASGASAGAGGGAGGGGGANTVAASSMDMSVQSSAMREDGSGPVDVTFTMFIPEHQQGDTFPLIIHSHGWGGSRIGVDEANADPDSPADIESTDSVFGRIDNQVRLLWDAGYAVVSFDERGFGRGDDGDAGNSGAVQIMDPLFETQDAISILDWVEANVPNIARDPGGNIIAGAIGGSYGGGYQILLAAFDDRLDAIVPTDTWNSLIQSLLPNEVIKKAFTAGLCLTATPALDNAELGERVTAACDQASTNQTTRYLDDFMPTLTLTVDDVVQAFTVNSLAHLEERHNDGSDPFTMRPLNALFIQGNRDILFNMTEAANSYRFMQSLGGDVRLMTNESGHGIPTRMLGGSQGALGPSTCGRFDSLAATRAWFDLHLRGNGFAEQSLVPEICISLGNNTGVLLNSLPVADAASTQFDPFTVTIPAATAVTAANNNSQTVADQAVFVPLASPIARTDRVLAGLPVANITIDDADAAASVNGGTTAFIGIGINRGGSLFLVDDQIEPLRASDPRTGATPQPIELIGVGEALQMGDVPGVLIYGSHGQYEPGTGVPMNFSANNRFTVSGTVRLPIFTATLQSR